MIDHAIPITDEDGDRDEWNELIEACPPPEDNPEEDQEVKGN